MEHTSLSKRVAIFIVPIVSSSLSLLSSGTISYMILRSKTKLSSPYRRLIFGLSVYDIFYSLGNVFSLAPVPPSDTIWGASGNRQTCEAQGFVSVLGLIGAPLYNLCLCIFHLSIIVFSMKRATFVTRVEPFLHGFTILFTWTVTIYLLVDGYYNPGGDWSVCWIAPYPRSCLKDPNVPCERGENAVQYRWIFVGYPVAAIFIFIVITMTIVSWKYYRQQKRILKYDFKQQAKMGPSNTESVLSSAISANQKSATSDDNSRKPRKSLLSLSSLRRSSNVSTVSSTHKRTKEREVMVQAMLYIIAYFITWGVSYSILIIEARKVVAPYAIRLTARILNPAQGAYNILVYTRPHVISLRKVYPEYSWLKAFITVVKSGGDNDGNVHRKFTQRRSFVGKK